MPAKSVLIICFTFPPAPGIGGRRWVKFAKYLRRNGNLVKVIGAQSQESEVSEWQKDQEELKEDSIFIKSSYPKYLGVVPGGMKEKILYRLSLFWAKLKNKGNYYDKSNYWKDKLLEASREIIKKHGIKNVICSVGPFRSSFFLLELKREFPGVNFILDYRDPWTNNKTSFGFTSLTDERFKYEVMMEASVVKGYDRITAVSAEMGIYFKDFLPDRELDKKFVSIPNGFDPEDFGNAALVNVEARNSEKVTVVFSGTFYIKSVHVFKRLAQTISVFEKAHPEQKGRLQFVFIGSVPDEIRNYFREQPHVFIFLGMKSLAEAYSITRAADFCSLFLTDDLNYSFSTKFYEYLGLGKKIISFSRYKGANARFIEENKLGLAVDFESMEKMISDLFLSPKEQFAQTTESTFAADSYNVENLAKQVESLLIE